MYRNLMSKPDVSQHVEAESNGIHRIHPPSVFFSTTCGLSKALNVNYKTIGTYLNFNQTYLNENQTYLRVFMLSGNRIVFQLQDFENSNTITPLCILRCRSHPNPGDFPSTGYRGTNPLLGEKTIFHLRPSLHLC